MVFSAYLFLGLLAAASAAPNSRVVGGDQVYIEEFPYAVAVTYYYPGPAFTIQRCVGALVSSFHVVTSGFCFTGANLNQMQIRAGSTYSLSGGILVDIDRFVKHEYYSQTPRYADLAVAFLSAPLGIGPNINILFLPPQDFSIQDGQEVKVVSWGYSSQQGPQLEILNLVLLNKLGIDECHNAYAGSEEVFINDNVICAAAPEKGMCYADSGAPMAINNVLVGTSSFFKDCSTDEFPDIFTRVDRYTNWILEVATPGGKAGRNGNFIDAPVVL